MIDRRRPAAAAGSSVDGAELAQQVAALSAAPPATTGRRRDARSCRLSTETQSPARHQLTLNTESSGVDIEVSSHHTVSVSKYRLTTGWFVFKVVRGYRR